MEMESSSIHKNNYRRFRQTRDMNLSHKVVFYWLEHQELFKKILFVFVFILVLFGSPRTVFAQMNTEEVSAAQGIEAMYIGQMIESLRKTVPDSEFMPKTQAEKIYESLLDQEYAETLSKTGNFGIAQQVLAEIHPQTE